MASKKMQGMNALLRAHGPYSISNGYLVDVNGITLADLWPGREPDEDYDPIEWDLELLELLNAQRKG